MVPHGTEVDMPMVTTGTILIAMLSRISFGRCPSTTITTAIMTV
jgi:hypothetical protein